MLVASPEKNEDLGINLAMVALLLVLGKENPLALQLRNLRL